MLSNDDCGMRNEEIVHGSRRMRRIRTDFNKPDKSVLIRRIRLDPCTISSFRIPYFPIMIGNLIIVSAPSGTGKTTLVTEVLKRDPRVKPSISYTSRAPRAGEERGVHYHFITRSEFEAMAGRGDFLEWAEVHGNLYGTSRRIVEDFRVAGYDVILTIDVQGAEQARKLFPDAVSIFILPPSYRSLIERLGARGANQTGDLQLRLRNAIDELGQYKRFDYVLINDDLSQATNELAAIILAERCRRERRSSVAEEILKTFQREVRSN
jgi:guanylate kinase